MKAVQTQQKEKPADFAIDFTKIQPGVNRNLNLREEFRHRLDMATIRSTSILNGAFMDMLTGTAPFILCFLKIDGEELSARRLQNIMTELSGTPFGLLRPGGLGGLKGLIRVTQLFSPERGEIYPPWQGMQYMHHLVLRIFLPLLHLTLNPSCIGTSSCALKITGKALLA